MVVLSEEVEPNGYRLVSQRYEQFGATHQSSIIQLTPQKVLPIPISPTQRPILSNASSITNNLNFQNQKSFNAYQLPLQKSDNKSSSSNAIKNSIQKTCVVYDEFKYYTQSNNNNGGSSTNTNTNLNGIKPIKTNSNNNIHILTNNPLAQQNTQYGCKQIDNVQNVIPSSTIVSDVLYSDGQLNEAQSPKQLATLDSNNKKFSTNQQFSKQELVLSTNGGNAGPAIHTDPGIAVCPSLNNIQKGSSIVLRSQDQKQRLYQQQAMQCKSMCPQAQSEIKIVSDQVKDKEDFPLGENHIYESKIHILQDQVENLEKELKKSQEKNFELQRKCKEKEILHSFERTNSKQQQQQIFKQNQEKQVSGIIKNLGDTEDSLILSEKKKNRVNKNSLLKGNQGSYYNHQNSAFSQSQSSILDVKIRSITNIKSNNTINSESNAENSKRKQTQLSSLQDKTLTIEQVNQDEVEQEQNRDDNEDEDEEYDNQMEYQVQTYRDQLTSEDNQEMTEFDYNSKEDEELEQNGEREGRLQQNESQVSQECESCERLKQLVFQAKEAIDDLKLEIEEWREISAVKETELRALQHKIYNDLIGIDKNVVFDDNVQTKEFDQAKPVNIDANRIKNFIMHNKKKLRSRSKNTNQNKNQKLKKESSLLQSATKSGQTTSKRKSALKRVQDIMSDDEIEFYQAEDQAVQTSFREEQNDESKLLVEKQKERENIDSIDTPKYILANEFPCKSRHKSIPSISQKYESLNNKDNQFSGQKDMNNINISKIMDQSSIQLQSQQLQQQDLIILDQLKSQNQTYEQEIQKMKQQLEQFQKTCEILSTLLTRVKRKNKQTSKKDTQLQLTLDEIKENCQIMSQLESYSILEKIHEWKKEEGISSLNKLPICKIPRPTKLIQELEMSEIEQIKSQLVLNNKNDINSILKREKQHLQQLQDQKYSELMKCQNDYLQQQLKSITKDQQTHSNSNSNSAATNLAKRHDHESVLAAVDYFIKKKLN